MTHTHKNCCMPLRLHLPRHTNILNELQHGDDDFIFNINFKQSNSGYYFTAYAPLTSALNIKR